MKDVSCGFDRLLPIEHTLSRQTVNQIVENYNISLFGRVLGVYYQDEIIIGDGHNRCYAAYQLGHESIPITLLESDIEIKNCKRGAFIHASTFDEFVYKSNIWMSKCRMIGIINFSSYQDEDFY